MPRPYNDEEYCPNCGQYTGGETTCPNCGAVLDNSGENDELDGFHEDGDEDVNELDIDDDDL